MSADKCPVDHSKWPTESSAPHPMRPDAAAIPRSAPAPAELSKDRVVSSIPRLFLGEESNKEEKWVYPSPAQFHAALQRKERAGEAKDMDIIVPIHNAVNERCWEQVMQWEAKEGPLDQVKLISFKGRPQDRTPRAWFKTIIGYQAPFDRHDWLVDRAGTRVRYVIDFYSGKMPLSFYLDVRPAVDSLSAVRMRFSNLVDRWNPFQQPQPASSKA